MATIKELQLARQKLATTNIVNGMPGREEQFEHIHNFLYERLLVRQKAPTKKALIPNVHLNKTIFICGVPGTGKTATVQAVIHKLNKLHKKDNCPVHKFTAIYINSQHLSSPQKLYSEIVFRLTGENMSPDRAQERLDKWFTTNQDIGVGRYKRVCKTKVGKKIEDDYKIIILDELDLLYSDKSQDVFYTLFDWPTSSNAKIVLIGIANAMDLAQKFMRGRITSRIGWETVVFSSYTSDGLEEILKSRLDEGLYEKCFEKSAITVATKRIGRTTGDARRILDTCSLGIDLAIEMKQKKVTAAIIDKVGFQNFDELKRKFIQECEPIPLMLLKSILTVISNHGEENVQVNEVIRQAQIILDRIPELSRMSPTDLDYYYWLEYLCEADLIALERNKPIQMNRIYFRDPSESFKDLIRNAKIAI